MTSKQHSSKPLVPVITSKILTDENQNENTVYTSEPDIFIEYWKKPIDKVFETNEYPEKSLEHQYQKTNTFDSLNDIQRQDRTNHKGIYIPSKNGDCKHVDVEFVVISHGVPFKYSEELQWLITGSKSKEYLTHLMHLIYCSIIYIPEVEGNPNAHIPEKSLYEKTDFIPTCLKYAISLYDKEEDKFTWVLLQLGSVYLRNTLGPILDIVRTAFEKYDVDHKTKEKAIYNAHKFEPRTLRLMCQPPTLEDPMPLFCWNFNFKPQSDIKSKREDSINKVLNKKPKSPPVAPSTPSSSSSKKRSTEKQEMEQIKKVFREEKKKERQAEKESIPCESDDEDEEEGSESESDSDSEGSSSSETEDKKFVTTSDSESDYTEDEESASESDSDPESSSDEEETGCTTIATTKPRRKETKTKKDVPQSSNVGISSTDLKAYSNMLLEEQPNPDQFDIKPVSLPQTLCMVTTSQVHTPQEIRDSFKIEPDENEKSFLVIYRKKYEEWKSKRASVPPLYDDYKFDELSELDRNRLFGFLLHMETFPSIREAVNNTELDVNKLINEYISIENTVCDLSKRIENSEENNIELNTKIVEIGKELDSKTQECYELQESNRNLLSTIDSLNGELRIQTNLAKKISSTSSKTPDIIKEVPPTQKNPPSTTLTLKNPIERKPSSTIPQKRPSEDSSHHHSDQNKKPKPQNVGLPYDPNQYAGLF